MAGTFTTDEVKADIISEKTAGSGVTIDGVTIKDGAVTTTAPSLKSVDPAITATGVDDTDGYALTKEVNVITGGAANTGVELPTAVVGLTITVANLTATAKKVYPNTGDAIDDETVTTGALTLSAEQVVTFYCYTTALWQSNVEDVNNHIAATAAHGATGAVVGTTNTQTLTNKTLTAPVIATISNTGVLTLPTSTDTLVGRATTDTLTNKTLSLAKVNIATGITAFATGGQASAVLLTGMFNNVGTCATAGDSVKLQPAAEGVIQIVKNSGVANLAVFPSSGDSIDENAADASITVAPQEMRIFCAVDGTVFHSAVMLADGALFGGISADYVQNNVPLGTPSAGVTAYQYGDGFDVYTVLDFTDLAVGAISAGASLAIGTQVFEFPTGMHHVSVMSSITEFTGIAGVTTDTPDVGIGSVIASGAVAVLGGTAEFEDYMTGVAAVNVSGSNTKSIYVPASSIAVSGTTTEKSVFLNVADAWDAGASGTLLASGTIYIKWTKMIV